MALQQKIVKIGKLEITVYDFEKKGDELPVHVHDETNNHISIVAKGSFKCIGGSSLVKLKLTTGQLINWKPGIEHGFVALEPNSRLVNIIK